MRRPGAFPRNDASAMPPQSPYTVQKTLMPRGGVDAAGTSGTYSKFRKILLTNV
jgi:hypothetical protein